MRREIVESGLITAPDGRVWALIRVDNKTGFGSGYLHHLAVYDPASGKIEDRGVLAVKNPDFYDFAAKKPWSYGFHRLPDGTLILPGHGPATTVGAERRTNPYVGDRA